ncbi:MAG: hypothetical protein ACXVIY_05200, partial [Mucilaginibacter sp.]
MEPEFIAYKKFDDAALANALAEALNNHGIEYLMEEEKSGFDPSFVMSNAPVDYVIKIKGEDFEEVNRLLKEDEEKNIDEVNDDYYLFSFTDDELMEVITKADEWSAFDVVLARKLLDKRGITINQEELSIKEEKRIEELKAVEPLKTGWIIIGYVFALGGGVAGIFFGWYLATGRKTLPNGERIHAFTEADRRQ